MRLVLAVLKPIVFALPALVCFNLLLLEMFIGALHAAGELITLPLRMPCVQRYFLTCLLPTLPHTLDVASNISY